MTIQEIREKIRRQEHINAKVCELRGRKNSLGEKEAQLRAVWQKEEADVNRLEVGSLAGFWYAMTGKKEQMLDREKQEAYAAKVKYDTVRGELDAVACELEALEAQLCSPQELEEQLRLAIQEKSQWLKQNCPDKAQEILRTEAEIAGLDSQIKEICEARAAGSRAEAIAGEVKRSLDSAAGWGTWDIIGGGMMSTMVKHSHLDAAQQKVNELQNCLAQFRTELADVSLEADMRVQIDGFLRFADYFWDGLFADWAVQSRIEKSREQIWQVQTQIQGLLMKLQRMEHNAQTEIKKKKAWLESYVQQ